MADEITQELRDSAAKEGPGSPEATKLAELEAAAKAAEETKPTEGNSEEKPTEKPAVEKESSSEEEELSLTAESEETPSESEGEEYSVEIPKSGNKVIDDVAKLLVDKKVPNADKIMAEFTENGELSLASQAALVETLGESVAQIALSNLSTEVSKLKENGKAKRQELLDYANETFKGEDPELTWKQMQEFVRSQEAGVSAEDLDAMNKMLKAGGLQGKLVVDRVAQLYYASQSTSAPGDLLEGDSYSGAANFKPISRMDYVAELRTAVQKYGEDSPQVRDLDRRREASIAKGY